MVEAPSDSTLVDKKRQRTHAKWYAPAHMSGIADRYYQSEAHRIGTGLAAVCGVKPRPSHLVGPLVVLLLVVSASPLMAQTLSWIANSEADIAGYTLLYGTQPGSSSVTLDVGNVTSRTLTGLQPGVPYYFRVRAYNTAGLVSVPSAEVTATVPVPGDTTPPTAPATLTATASGSTQIALSWSTATDNVGVTGYRVERCTGSSCTAFAEVGTTTSTSYSNTGLTASTTYRFRVRAVDAA
ncbi:MAG: fibronectin type III domain-containing protein, partial [Vicinamibacteraceae bacterium]